VFARSGAAAASILAAGCAEGPSDGLDRKAVHGKVTLDGAPLAKGAITFDPAEGQSGAVGSGAAVVDGAYSIDAAQGPTPGKYKVSIRSAGGDAPVEKAAPGMPPRKAAPDPIPKQYNSASTLTAEVGPGGSTVANFELSTK
jgi:hypothetical protein